MFMNSPVCIYFKQNAQVTLTKLERGMIWTPTSQLYKVIHMQDNKNQINIPKIVAYTAKKQT